MLDLKTNISCVLESVFAGFKDENIEIAAENITKLYINDLIKLKAEMLENIVITLKDETDEAVLEHNKTIYSNIAIIDNHIYELKGEQNGKT